MKCVHCGESGLKKTTTAHEVHIGDRKVTVVVAASKCPKCGETHVDGATLERAELLVAEHVARSGNVSGDTFRLMRKVLGLQAKELSEIIGTPAETISRWEKGVRDVDKFAWVTLAAMVIDATEERAPVTRDVLLAIQAPRPFPKVVKVA